MTDFRDLSVREERHETLHELSDWLFDQIDGAEESRGHDQRISRFIEAVAWAIHKTEPRK